MTIHQEPRPNTNEYPDSYNPSSTEILGQITTEQAQPEFMTTTTETPDSTPFLKRRPVVIGGAVAAAAGLLSIGVAVGSRGHDSIPSKPAVLSTQPNTTSAPTNNATPNSEATPSPTDIPSTTTLPSSEASASTSGIPSETHTISPEKGSLESYQISVDKYPTAEAAMPAFGDLIQEYFTSGIYDMKLNDETAASKKAGDTMLEAIFGDALTDQGSLIEGTPSQAGWKKLRTAIPRFRLSIEGINGQGGMAGPGEKMKYSFGYQTVADTEQQLSENTFSINVVATQSSNISEFFPEQHFDSQTSQNIRLKQVDGKNGKVWEITWIAVQ